MMEAGTGDRTIVIESVDRTDSEWFTESEAIEHLSESFGPVFPDGLDDEERQAVYDAPWDHPRVPWMGPNGERFRVRRGGLA